MPKEKKNMDVAGSEKPAEAATDAATSSHDANGKRPIWSRNINRVNCAVWKHDQEEGTRYTVALYRSYLDRRNNEWKRVYYFDRQDLKDVRAVCNEAEAYIASLDSAVPVIDK